MKNRNHLISPCGKNFAGWCSPGGGAGVAALGWEYVALPTSQGAACSDTRPSDKPQVCWLGRTR